MTLPIGQTIPLRMIEWLVNNELWRTWKEVVVAWYHLLIIRGKIRKATVKISGPKFERGFSCGCYLFSRNIRPSRKVGKCKALNRLRITRITYQEYLQWILPWFHHRGRPYHLWTWLSLIIECLNIRYLQAYPLVSRAIERPSLAWKSMPFNNMCISVTTFSFIAEYSYIA
jgi:hypothetical protein